MSKVGRETEVVVSYEYITRPHGTFRRKVKGHMISSLILDLAQKEVKHALGPTVEPEDLVVTIEVREASTQTPSQYLGEHLPVEYEGDDK